MVEKNTPVFSAADITQVSHIQNILAAEGIETYITNQYLSGGAGEIPIFECWPKLFVVSKEQWAAARRIVEDYLHAPAVEGDWTCPRCGALVNSELALCWSCGCAWNQPASEA